MLETESVHDGDSMVVNFPCEEDHDEVRIVCFVILIMLCKRH